MLCAKFGLDWLSGTGEKDFKIFSMYYRYILIISSFIFASQVSDSLALIYPLADLVGFSKPSQ